MRGGPFRRCLRSAPVEGFLLCGAEQCSEACSGVRAVGGASFRELRSALRWGSALCERGLCDFDDVCGLYVCRFECASVCTRAHDCRLRGLFCWRNADLRCFAVLAAMCMAAAAAREAHHHDCGVLIIIVIQGVRVSSAGSCLPANMINFVS